MNRGMLSRQFTRRAYSQSMTPPARTVGAGEAKSWTPVSDPPPVWYKQPQFKRNLVNILLLASFANSAAIILSYKSQKREITWKTKERVQTLRETIEKVRRGEEIDIRAALGTGDPEMEKRWTEVLREIEAEDMIWQGKSEDKSSKSSSK